MLSSMMVIVIMCKRYTWESGSVRGLKPPIVRHNQYYSLSDIKLHLCVLGCVHFVIGSFLTFHEFIF